MTKTPRGLNEAPRGVQTRGHRPSNSEDWQFGRCDPAEGPARLNLKEGDKLYPVEQPDGGLRLSPFNPKHAQTMEIARKVMHKYRDTFAALAK